MKKLRVTIEGKSYDVLVEVLDAGAAVAVAPAAVAPASVAVASVSPPVASAAPTAAPAGAAPGEVRSPLAGKIVSIDVKVGANVSEGAQVATIEAMKMNTYITAPKAGKVAAVHVNAGDAVQEGALLLNVA